MVHIAMAENVRGAPNLNNFFKRFLSILDTGLSKYIRL